MTWQDVLGHDEVREWFRRSVAAGRLASTFLFVGPSGIGKRTFAVQLAQALLCETSPEPVLDACGECSSCRQVAVGTHPDLQIVGKPADKNLIPLELLIGDRDHRMQEGLCHDISLKPFYGGRKVALIDDADYLNAEGANCLLKTLEEPPPRSVLVLIGTSEQRQLPTIRSRSQIIRFRPLTNEQVAVLLLQTGIAANEDEARELSALSGGSLEQARRYADPEVREFRQRWLQYLATGDDQWWGFVKELNSFVEAAGKEAPPRRARLKHIAQMAATFYQGLIEAACGQPSESDPVLAQAVQVGAQRYRGDLERLADCLERCIDLELQIDANANLATLAESWLDDLVQLRA